MTIRRLSFSDIPRVISLHKDTIQSPGSRIGTTYLSGFYHLFLRKDQIFSCFVALDDSSIVGVISGSLDVGKAQKFMMSLRIDWRIVAATAWSLLRTHVMLKQLYDSSLVRDYVHRRNLAMQGVTGSLLSLAIDKRS